MGIFGLFKKKRPAHSQGDTQCGECPDHWPIEHQNCGGLFHANSQISALKRNRYVVCDKCGQGVELQVIGDIGSTQFSEEAARQLERKMLADLTRSNCDEGPTS